MSHPRGCSILCCAPGDPETTLVCTQTPMMEKLMTSRTPVKAYDMKLVQSMRRGQFWASLFMCYTHLKRGMIKPMILQVMTRGGHPGWGGQGFA